nr:unnamed protein product [Callosobruchus analis]
MQSLMKFETQESRADPKKCVMSFDLQQPMPIPKLTTGPPFYCRKIWLYNLGPILSNIANCTKTDGGANLHSSKVFSLQFRASDAVNGEYKEVNLRKKGETENKLFESNQKKNTISPYHYLKRKWKM